ncbi:MAG TPA: hypothetical protein VGH57_09815 [Amycolatopsis sp.]
MRKFLARRSRLPAEPSSAEVAAARKWLARHGIEVAQPTQLLCIRIVAHLAPSTWLRSFPVYAVVGIVGGLAYTSLEWVPGVRGREMTESVPLYFIFAAIQVGLWRARRVRERTLVELVPSPLTLQTAVAIAQRRRKMPPGHYGTTDSGTRETAPTTADNTGKPATRD